MNWLRKSLSQKLKSPVVFVEISRRIVTVSINDFYLYLYLLYAYFEVNIIEQVSLELMFTLTKCCKVSRKFHICVKSAFLASKRGTPLQEIVILLLLARLA